MSIKDNPKFQTCVEIAQEAKSLRKQASNTESQAVLKFRELISDTIKPLKEQETELKEKLGVLEEKRKQLGKFFCSQIGHDYQQKCIESQTLKHRKSLVIDEGQSVCIIECKRCGESKVSEPFYENHDAYECLKSLNESNTIPAWKATAEEFEKINQEINDINSQLLEIIKELNEICTLFGHDANRIDSHNEIFRCKCCGKIMDYIEYANVHYNAKYKGGIVYYYDGDRRPIFD